MQPLVDRTFTSRVNRRGSIAGLPRWFLFKASANMIRHRLFVALACLFFSFPNQAQTDRSLFKQAIVDSYCYKLWQEFDEALASAKFAKACRRVEDNRKAADKLRETCIRLRAEGDTERAYACFQVAGPQFNDAYKEATHCKSLEFDLFVEVVRKALDPQERSFLTENPES